MSKSLRALASVMALLVGGCSLIVNAGQENHPCGLNDECLPGYACNSKGICVAESKAQCPTACANGTKCVRQQCVPICESTACAPGLTCGSSGCEPVTATGSVGTPCMTNADCGTDLSLFCLQPYTGGPSAQGVCTQQCDHSAADTCPNGSVCTTFPSSSQDGIDLCANPGLTPCHNDSACEPSGLACEVLFGKVAQGGLSAAACGLKIDGGAALGAPCKLQDGPCANGLCVISQIGAQTVRVCSAPCQDASDCSGLLSGICAPVTINQKVDSSATTPPITRMSMCILPPTTIGSACTSATNNRCGADAPHCVPSSVNPGANICAPDCTDTLDSRCPSGSGLTCNGATGTCN